MNNSFPCSECGATVRLPYSPKITTVACGRCGDVSMITDGKVRRMYPALHMQPMSVNEPLVVSAWMPTRTRPVAPGEYQCRFRTTGDAILPLYWDGVCFRALDNVGSRVKMGDFLTWRGVLA